MTETPSNRQSAPRSYPSYCDEEIKLIDYLRILWKWKWVIVAGTLICAVAAAVISLQMPKVFEISTNIVPPMTEFSPETQKITYIDTPDRISGKIMSGMYNEKIRKSLALDPSQRDIAFDSTAVTGTDILDVVSRWREEDIDRGMKATRLLLQVLSEEYAETIESMKSDFDRQIEVKRQAIQEIQEAVKLQDAILADIEQRKEKLSKAMQEIERNNGKITGLAGSPPKEGSHDTATLRSLYAITINQIRFYYCQLDRQLYDVAMDKRKIEIEQKKFTVKIREISDEIKALNTKKEMISNIKIIKDPEISPRPVAPRTKQTTLLAGAVALCFFVFLAFFIEAIKMHFPRAGKRV